MLIIIGSIIVVVCVAGGYVLAHGDLAALWQPYEVLIICGAAFGAFVISNPPRIIKASFSGFMGALKGTKFQKALYMDMLSLMYTLLTKARKEGTMAIEVDIENPSESKVFSEYPSLSGDHHIVDFICDYMRMVITGGASPFEIDNLLDIELQTHHQQAVQPSEAVTKVADALPGFGIVAAVLGIVITMGSLGGPPEEIGAHVAAALVGTFLGILLAYGFVAPLALAMEHQVNEEAKFYECMKVVIMAAVNGYSPALAVEFGRKAMFPTDRPSFLELEEHVKQAGKG